MYRLVYGVNSSKCANIKKDLLKIVCEIFFTPLGKTSNKNPVRSSRVDGVTKKRIVTGNTVH